MQGVACEQDKKKIGIPKRLHYRENTSTGFEPGSVHVGYVVNIVALEEVFLQVLQFSSVHITPPGRHDVDHVDGLEYFSE
jgi:hypothetical protein